MKMQNWLGRLLIALFSVPVIILAQELPFDEEQNVTPPGTAETVVSNGAKASRDVPKAPAVVPMESKGKKSVTTASAQFDQWFAEAMAIAKDWEFPDLTNQYGEKITREDFMRAVLWIESNGVHKDGKGLLTKSWVGAIGFGQLMPNTARGLGVDPKDPRQNLLGSAKYIKEIMNSNNIQAIQDPVKKIIMSMAAYNLGPYSKLLKRDWDVLKARGPAETAGYGLKLKMCLGLPMSNTEKVLTAKYLGVKMNDVDNLADEYYAHSHGL